SYRVSGFRAFSYCAPFVFSMFHPQPVHNALCCAMSHSAVIPKFAEPIISRKIKNHYIAFYRSSPVARFCYNRLVDFQLLKLTSSFFSKFLQDFRLVQAHDVYHFSATFFASWCEQPALNRRPGSWGIVEAQAHPCARILETRNAAFRAGGRTLPSCFSAQANRSFVFLRSDRAVPAIASHIRVALDSGEAGFSPAFRTSERRACHAIPPPP